jgi:hypothetical protein
MSSIITDELKRMRPEIADSSLKTYTSLLTNLHKSTFGKDEPISIDSFRKKDEIVKTLSNASINTCKTTLSALVVLTGMNEYRELMLEQIAKYKTNENKQQMSEKQIKNEVSQEEIDSEYDELKKIATALYKKRNINLDDLQQIQQYIIASLYFGYYIAPRRAENIKVKLKDFKSDTDNYIKGNKIIYNQYKTSKFYGRQEILMPVPLRKIIKKWVEVNPTGFLLFDTKFQPLTSVSLNQRINKLFTSKKVGINGLRHSYMSKKYGDTIDTNKDIADDLEAMGSSSAQEAVYIKE